MHIYTGVTYIVPNIYISPCGN